MIRWMPDNDYSDVEFLHCSIAVFHLGPLADNDDSERAHRLGPRFLNDDP